MSRGLIQLICIGILCYWELLPEGATAFPLSVSPQRRTTPPSFGGAPTGFTRSNKSSRDVSYTILQSSASGLTTTSTSSSSSSSTVTSNGSTKAVPFAFSRRAATSPLSMIRTGLTKAGLIGFILGMCISLPLTLAPQWMAYKLGFLSRVQKERYAVLTSEFCARWMLRIFPFMRVEAYPYHDPNPPASIWVCNHSSMLDVFVLLAADKRLRGRTRRPIKIVYWKQLEDNPVTALLFKQAGFIPVQMAANKAGEDNDYDKSSFRRLIKDSKQAFAEGFDIGILPEGQLNPHPESGLMPLFSGAFTLARMSRRPIQMLALHGVHRLWHPVDGMCARNRRVKARVYPTPFRFQNGEDFCDTFEAVVGEFATKGHDLPQDELQAWMHGAKNEAIKLKKNRSRPVDHHRKPEQPAETDE